MSISKNIVLTGGMGYIGSHTVVELLNLNHRVTIVDTNCEYYGSQTTKTNLLKLIPSDRVHCLIFKAIDITDEYELEQLFAENKFDVCIHFAALKNVEESQRIPLTYYYNNVGGLLNLLACCATHGCYEFIFSSSCTVYGNDQQVPFVEKSVDELDSRTLTNPYATTKYMCEKILSDLCEADSRIRCISLRYFNPVGAHHSGLLGDAPLNNRPSNLMPVIVDVMDGTRKELHIYGYDYDTVDGTCVRDFIHVCDVARAHVFAMNKLPELSTGENHIYNIGTGEGYSVLQLVNAMSEVINVPIPHIFKPRREGDLPSAYADISKSRDELGFVAEKTIQDMCRDSYNFRQKEKIE